MEAYQSQHNNYNYTNYNSTRRNHRTAMEKCNMHLFGFTNTRDITRLNANMVHRPAAAHNANPIRARKNANAPPAPVNDNRRTAFRRRNSRSFDEGSGIMNEGFQDIRRVRSHDEMELKTSIDEFGDLINVKKPDDNDAMITTSEATPGPERKDSPHIIKPQCDGDGEEKRRKAVTFNVLDEFLLQKCVHTRSSIDWAAEIKSNDTKSKVQCHEDDLEHRHVHGRFVRRGGMIWENRRRRESRE